jgi:transcriptional regulator with XRE-family HTH domain
MSGEQPAVRPEEKFSSVSRMIDAISGDDELADAVKKRIAQRQIVKTLFAMRAARGVSQAQIATALGCTQSRVSKIENGFDGDLNFRELEAYARVLDHDVRLVFMKRGATSADRVKMHALGIRNELEQMAECARGDESIAEAVAGFFGEAFFNLVRLVQSACGKLPNRSNDEPYIHIGFAPMPGDDDDATLTTRRAARQSPAAGSIHAHS